ncbi:hypothetical protein NLI96_g8674 [Meripilus lineatus]|uniref:Uncharacterized protein n=1 Tax=Meripilus lineatus TaxID=2056292 RepID=A0AAD5YG26_9APHY|nr:hypothetical protein NLI96_g8674 [Physisporinus lineatus]
MSSQHHEDQSDSEDECPLYSEEGFSPTSDPVQPRIRYLDFDLEDALRSADRRPACPPCSRVSRRPGEIFQDDLHGFVSPEEDADLAETAEGYPAWTRARKKQNKAGKPSAASGKQDIRSIRRRKKRQFDREALRNSLTHDRKITSWLSRKNSNVKAHLLNFDISSLQPCRGAYRAHDHEALKTVKPMKILRAKLNPTGGERPWTDVHDDTVEAMQAASEGIATFACQQGHRGRGGGGGGGKKGCDFCSNRRGNYRSVSVGLSHGQGQDEPAMLHVDDGPAQAAVATLLENEGVKRAIGFASIPGSDQVALWSPNMYDSYRTVMGQYYKRDPQRLKRILPSVYPAFTFNLGPRTVTVEHYDSRNKANGWIAITAFGNYNPDLGGHLILRELGLMIRFPPGSTILFPSAIIRHGNAPIQKGEFRMSITSYAAGALFQYLDYGFELKKKVQATNPTLYKEMERKEATAWEEAVKIYSKVDELLADRKAVFGIKSGTEMDTYT